MGTKDKGSSKRSGSSSQGRSKGGKNQSGGGKKRYASKGGTGKPKGGRPQSKGSSPSGPKKSSGRKKQYSATTRSVEAKRRQERSKERRRDLTGAAVNLPNWVIEGLERVTPADRIAPALEALGAASEALADANYQQAVKHGLRAKALAPNDPTTRETIGLAAYRLGDWQQALNELRAYRRIAGETTHLPVEMDILRALGRDSAVENAWKELSKRGGHGLVMNEGKVVYGSYLLDKGRARDAWDIVNPGRTVENPNEAHLRLYFVAARTAAALRDRETAKQLSDIIVLSDPSFPGWDQLESEIAAITANS